MLQLYIMTGSRAMRSQTQLYMNDIPEPLPLGTTTSMFIRSGLIFHDVLPESFSPANGWKLEGVDPKASNKAWSGRFSSASVQGTVDLSRLNHSESPRGGDGVSATTTYYSYFFAGGNTVTWSLEGTTLAVQQNGRLKYDGSQKQTLTYTEHAEEITATIWRPISKKHDNQFSTEVTVIPSAVLPLSVEGTEQNQTIQIKTSARGVTVSGHLSGGGPCNKDDLNAQVNQQINAQVPAQIADKLSLLSFKAISVFALKNLLFPTNNYISFTSCAIPGDMLLLGNFKQLVSGKKKDSDVPYQEPESTKSSRQRVHAAQACENTLQTGSAIPTIPA